MRFLSVALKEFREIVRDKQGLAMLLAFPAVFMLVFGFAFSGGQGQSDPYKLGVVNEDQGAMIASPEGGSAERNFGDELLDALQEATFEESDAQLFEVTRVDLEEGRSSLQERELAALLQIPSDFSRAVNQLIKATARREVTSQVGEMIIRKSRDISDSGEVPDVSEFVPSGTDGEFQEEFDGDLPKIEDVVSELTITGDPGYIAYGRARGILNGVLEGFLEEISIIVREEVSSSFAGGRTQQSRFVKITSDSISGSSSLSIFDYQAPGILVFAVLIAAIGVATALAGEVEEGTLERLKLTKMNSLDLLLGTLVPWSLVAVIQVLVLFATALLIGFSWAGGINSLLFAMVVAAVAGVASVALGLLIAAFADSAEHASNLGTLITVPLSFVSGAFFPLPELVLVNVFGYRFELYDVLPWSHASDALRMLLSYGGEPEDVAVELGFMAGLTIVLFFVGVFLFARNRLSARK
ncbi:MAG: ABC transporter permease [Candidatus Acetothermia bacterium]